jgi:large subunit ribosomal protein L18
MNKLAQKLHNRVQRKNRVRSVVSGTATRPRLSVFISNQNITAQLIDDTNHKTLAYVTTVGRKDKSGTMTEKAVIIGTEIATKAKEIKIRTIVFDRGGKI